MASDRPTQRGPSCGRALARSGPAPLLLCRDRTGGLLLANHAPVRAPPSDLMRRSAGEDLERVGPPPGFQAIPPQADSNGDLLHERCGQRSVNEGRMGSMPCLWVSDGTAGG